MEAIFPVIKTDPTIEQLQEISLSVAGLSINGIDDKEGFDKVKDHRIKLKNIRVEITKQCKALREEAIKYQKDVISHEKGLISIIEPSELKLKEMEEEIKTMQEIEKRKKILPARMDEVERNKLNADPDFILSLSSDEFNSWILTEREKRVSEIELAGVLGRRREIWNTYGNTPMSDDYLVGYSDDEFDQRVRDEIEKKKNKENEMEIKNLKEKLQKEEAEKNRIEIEEKNKLRSDNELHAKKEYQSWLAIHKYNEKTHLVVDENGKKILYEKIAEFLLPVNN